MRTIVRLGGGGRALLRARFTGALGVLTSIPIQSTASLGAAIRAARRLSRVRIDDLAATAGVSKQFTQDVEHGKPTVQFGRVLELLAELGIPLEVDIPDEAARALANSLTEGDARHMDRRQSADSRAPRGSKKRV